jgi:hypothetical protein
MTMQIDEAAVLPDAPASADIPAPQGSDPAAQAAAEQQDGNAAEQKQEQEQPELARDERGRFKGVQARIDELTRARHQSDREAVYWREMAQQQQQREQQAQAEPVAKPQAGQFASYDEFTEALADWKAEAKIRSVLSERDAQAAQRAEGAARQAQQATFAERVSIAQQSIADFDQVVGNAEVEISPHVREVLLDSDAGPVLAYVLAKNPDEARRISKMSPLMAARELGRIEAAIAQNGVPPASPAAGRPVSNAPAPARTTATGTSASKDPARMSMDEYVSWRKSTGAGWSR